MSTTEIIETADDTWSAECLAGEGRAVDAAEVAAIDDSVEMLRPAADSGVAIYSDGETVWLVGPSLAVGEEHWLITYSI